MKLTKEQIENWRRILTGMVGPYALIMSDEEIQVLKDEFQAKAKAFEKEKSNGLQS